eukprot:SAG11_NODE_2396_length_3406_cov_2.071666_2_plen_47_part_00
MDRVLERRARELDPASDDYVNPHDQVERAMQGDYSLLDLNHRHLHT